MIVAQSKSFTVAAKQQYISQPAVSRQMAALETELGAELFDRTRNTIQLTSAGQHLARHLFPILEHLDALLEEGTSGMFPVHLHLGIYITTPEGQEISVNPYHILQCLRKKIRKCTYY